MTEQGNFNKRQEIFMKGFIASSCLTFTLAAAELIASMQGVELVPTDIVQASFTLPSGFAIAWILSWRIFGR